MNIKYEGVTELAGAPVSAEQIQGFYNRYRWAAEYCCGRAVFDVAADTGAGLGLLADVAGDLIAGDITEPFLRNIQAAYWTGVALRCSDAQALPLADASRDVILIVEALYYLPDVNRFISECRRVLRTGGHLLIVNTNKVLIVNTNKDIFGFHPSPYSHAYHGVIELNALLDANGFVPEFFGDTPIAKVSLAQRILQPVKWLAVRFNLLPKTMHGKELLRRLVFGPLRPMPGDLRDLKLEYMPPLPLGKNEPDSNHKIIFCAAQMAG